MNFVRENKKLIAFAVIMVLTLGVLTGMLVYETVTSDKKNNELKTDNNSYKSENEELQSQIDDFEQALEKSSENEKILQDQNAEQEKKIAELESKLDAALLAKKNKANGKTVYLTFDDGPSANTPKILKILKENGVKATFFVINGRYNEYMKDIVNEGHTLALHTYSHDYSKIYSSEAAYFEDLQKISDVVKEQTGIESKIMRFPGGGSNAISKKYNSGIMTRLIKQVGEKGYVYFDWNCSIEDAVAGAPIPVERLMSNLRTSLGSNQGEVIVLMHDTNKLTTTVDALPKIISFFKEKGYAFGVITENTIPVHHKPNN